MQTMMMILLGFAAVCSVISLVFQWCSDKDDWAVQDEQCERLDRVEEDITYLRAACWRALKETDPATFHDTKEERA